jgi:hypothetical protein
MGNGRNWNAAVLRKKQATGQLKGVKSEEENPLQGLFKHEGERNARLTHYLRTSPSGERDLEPLLDQRLASKVKGWGDVTWGEREAWSRGILDAWAD